MVVVSFAGVGLPGQWHLVNLEPGPGVVLAATALVASPVPPRSTPSAPNVRDGGGLQCHIAVSSDIRGCCSVI